MLDRPAPWAHACDPDTPPPLFWSGFGLPPHSKPRPNNDRASEMDRGTPVIDTSRAFVDHLADAGWHTCEP